MRTKQRFFGRFLYCYSLFLRWGEPVLAKCKCFSLLVFRFLHLLCAKVMRQLCSVDGWMDRHRHTFRYKHGYTYRFRYINNKQINKNNKMHFFLCVFFCCPKLESIKGAIDFFVWEYFGHQTSGYVCRYHPRYVMFRCITTTHYGQSSTVNLAI